MIFKLIEFHLFIIFSDTVQTCLNCTAVINFQDTKGNAAIHYALESEDTDILKSLIQNGADINLKGKHDNTPLMVAVYKQNFSAMKLLLDYEADVKLVDKDGNTFFDILLEIRNSDLVETIARHHR